MKNVLLSIVWAYAVFAIIFGVEPQISMSSGFKKMKPFTYSEYITMVTKLNGNSVAIKSVATLAYPGAKLGRLLHNVTSDK
jgi:hypothetical protein